MAYALAEKNQWDMLQTLLAAAQAGNVRVDLSVASGESCGGHTVLHLSVQKGAPVCIVEKLLSLGAPVNAKAVYALSHFFHCLASTARGKWSKSVATCARKRFWRALQLIDVNSFETLWYHPSEETLRNV